MSQPMTAPTREEIEALSDGHGACGCGKCQYCELGRCVWCGDIWPCPTVRLIEAYGWALETKEVNETLTRLMEERDAQRERLKKAERLVEAGQKFSEEHLHWHDNGVAEPDSKAHADFIAALADYRGEEA